MDIFVQRLRQAMFLSGLRQKDICEKTGFSDSQMSNWHKGRYRPNAEAMAKIAKALGVSVEYLLGKEDVSPAKLTKPIVREIHVLGKVAAGVPIIAQEDVRGTIMTDRVLKSHYERSISDQFRKDSEAIVLYFSDHLKTGN